MEQRLESQERLITEIYEVKLSDMEGNLKDHVDARYNDLQTFITKALRDMTTAPIAQQSQPAGLANGSVMVENPPMMGVDYKIFHPRNQVRTSLAEATKYRRVQREGRNKQSSEKRKDYTIRKTGNY